MVKAEINFLPETGETLPFARSFDNWFFYNNPEQNAARLEQLKDPSYYKDGRAPDLIIMGPAYIRISMSVISDSKPRAYVSIGARGNYELPLRSVGKPGETLYKVEVVFSDGIKETVEVWASSENATATVLETAKARALVLRGLQSTATVQSASIIESTKASGSEQLYLFDYYVPFSVPTPPNGPVDMHVFVLNEAGEMVTEKRLVTCLEHRLSPGLEPGSATTFFATIADAYFKEYGFKRALEQVKQYVALKTVEIPGRDQIKEDFEAWYNQRGAVHRTLYYGDITGRGIGESFGPEMAPEYTSVLDGFILSHESLNDPSYTYNLVELVNDICLRAAGNWLPGLVQSYLTDIATGQWNGNTKLTADIPEIQSTRTLEQTTPLPDNPNFPQGSFVYRKEDPGGQYGDYYYVVIPPLNSEDTRIRIVGEDGSLYFVFDSAEPILEEEGITDEISTESVAEVKQQEFREFLTNFEAALMTTQLLWSWSLSPDERTPQVGQMFLKEGVQEYFPTSVELVPILPELPITAKMPQILHPALGQPGTFSGYDTRVLASLLEQTVFPHWTGEILRRFGDVREYSDFQYLHETAKAVMTWWNDLATRNRDSRKIVLEIPEALDWENTPDLVYAYNVMTSNMGVEMRYERLPYDDITMLPPLWFWQRLRRYFDMQANYYDIYTQAKYQVGSGPNTTSGPYWPIIFELGGKAYNAAERIDYIFDLSDRLDTGAVDERELAEAQQFCLDVYNSTEVQKRFPELWVQAIYLYNKIDPQNRIEINPAAKAAYTAPVASSIERIKSLPFSESSAQLLQKIEATFVDRGLIPKSQERLHAALIQNKSMIEQNISRLLTMGDYWQKIYEYISDPRNYSSTGQEDETALKSLETQYLETLTAFQDNITRDLATIGINVPGLDQNFVGIVLANALRPIEREFSEKSAGIFTASDRDDFLQKLTQIEESFPDYLADNIFKIYTVNTDALLEAADQFTSLISTEDFMRSYLADPANKQLQQEVAAALIDESFGSKVAAEFNRLLRTEVANRMRNLVFESEDKLAAYIDKTLSATWNTACQNVTRQHQFGPDLLAALSQLELYLGSGYLVFHQGQRFITRFLIGGLR